jgi:hypothetical protein
VSCESFELLDDGAYERWALHAAADEIPIVDQWFRDLKADAEAMPRITIPGDDRRAEYSWIDKTNAVVVYRVVGEPRCAVVLYHVHDVTRLLD